MDDEDKQFLDRAKDIGFEKSAKLAVPIVNELVRRGRDLSDRENISEDGDKELLALIQMAFEGGFDVAIEAFQEGKIKNSDNYLPGV